MSNQGKRKKTIRIKEPIPATREEYEAFLKREPPTCDMEKDVDGEGRWSCSGECVINMDYQEICAPRSFFKQDGEPIYWCECIPWDDLPGFVARGEAIKAGWPSIPDTGYMPQEYEIWFE